MTSVVLELNEVAKRFDDVEVLKGVSLTLHRHEVVCLIGASGSGKSTLLRCANLLESVDGGSVSLFGQSLSDPRVSGDLVRRHVGMVFQSFNLFPHLNVLDNVLLGPVRALKRRRDEATDEALALLERIGLRVTSPIRWSTWMAACSSNRAPPRSCSPIPSTNQRSSSWRGSANWPARASRGTSSLRRRAPDRAPT